MGKGNKKNGAKASTSDYPAVNPAHASEMFPPASSFSFDFPSIVTLKKKTLRELTSTLNTIGLSVSAERKKLITKIPAMDALGQQLLAHQEAMQAFTDAVVTEFEDMNARMDRIEAKIAISFASKQEVVILGKEIDQLKKSTASKEEISALVKAEMAILKEVMANKDDSTVARLEKATAINKEEFDALIAMHEETCVAFESTFATKQDLAGALKEITTTYQDELAVASEDNHTTKHNELVTAMNSTYATKNDLADALKEITTAHQNELTVALEDEATTRREELVAALEEVKSDAKAPKKSFWSVLGNVLDDLENESSLNELFFPQGAYLTAEKGVGAGKEVGAGKGVNVEKIPGALQAGGGGGGGSGSTKSSGFCSVM